MQNIFKQFKLFMKNIYYYENVTIKLTFYCTKTKHLTRLNSQKCISLNLMADYP